MTPLETQADPALAELMELVEGYDHAQSRNRLALEYSTPVPAEYVGPRIGPYPWQMRYHEAGIDNQERGIIAANRVGKTSSATAERAIHLTGRYPDWWTGKRFHKAITTWVGSNTNETSRDIVQQALLGSPDAWGTGWIPADCFDPKRDLSFRQCGISDVVDAVSVKHVSGRYSRLMFKTYEQGRRKWQGTSVEDLLFDEEPPGDIFTEGLTRVLDARGLCTLSFTPLEGFSDVVAHFLDGGLGIWCITVGWEQAPHLSPEDCARLLASFPEHERDARARGIPMMGSGAIYRIADDEITCDAFPIPRHFRRGKGVDFGIDHPFAAVELAYDADADCIYVIEAKKIRGQTPVYHAPMVVGNTPWVPVFWPHDGQNKGKDSGVPLKEHYLKHGVRMWHASARHDDKTGGRQGREAIVMQLDERMRSGRFKVFRHLHEWLEEKRMFHRKDGRIVAERDDLMSATEYAVMMLRHWTIETPRIVQDVADSYDPLASYAA